jgi:hypothetical protein
MLLEFSMVRISAHFPRLSGRLIAANSQRRRFLALS